MLLLRILNLDVRNVPVRNIVPLSVRSLEMLSNVSEKRSKRGKKERIRLLKM